MKENLVSIIVPVYNSEKWIERCVNSVLAQTYKDWQLILIDDGSEDNTPGILDDYKEKDHRIIVFHIKNGGVANARNVGLSATTGEYITFCDSDDYYEPDYLETLINLYKESGAGLCVASYFIDKGRSVKTYKPTVVGFFKEEELSNMVQSFHSVYWKGLWNKLFLARIIKDNRIEFPAFSIYEDCCFILDYISKIDSVCCIDKPIYHYVQINTNSLSKKYNKEALKFQKVFTEKISFLADKYSCNDEEFKNKWKMFYYEILCGQVFSCLLSETKEEEKRKIFRLLRSDKGATLYAKKSQYFSYWVIGSLPYFINKIYFFMYKYRK